MPLRRTARIPMSAQRARRGPWTSDRCNRHARPVALDHRGQHIHCVLTGQPVSRWPSGPRQRVRPVACTSGPPARRPHRLSPITQIARRIPIVYTRPDVSATRIPNVPLQPPLHSPQTRPSLRPEPADETPRRRLAQQRPAATPAQSPCHPSDHVAGRPPPHQLSPTPPLCPPIPAQKRPAATHPSLRRPRRACPEPVEGESSLRPPPHNAAKKRPAATEEFFGKNSYARNPAPFLTPNPSTTHSRPQLSPSTPPQSSQSRPKNPPNLAPSGPGSPLRGSRGRWARVPHKARQSPSSPSHWPPAMPPPIMAALTRQGRDPCQSEPSTSAPGTEPAPTSAS